MYSTVLMSLEETKNKKAEGSIASELHILLNISLGSCLQQTASNDKNNSPLVLKRARHCLHHLEIRFLEKNLRCNFLFSIFWQPS